MNTSRVALVTGSGRGIGRAIAIMLAQNGWSMVLNYRSDTKSAKDTMNHIKNAGGSVICIQADISLAADRQNLVHELMTRSGRIDLLVNNAGIAPRQRTDLLKVSQESFIEVLNTNLIGPFFLSQSVANLMIDLLKAKVIPDARIINIGSMSAYTASVERSEYCISKAGMGMMTALFATRLAEYGIGVYEIRPGIIETEMTRTVKEKYNRLIFEEGLTPIRRWGTPEDVARAVLAIANGAFDFSTGEVINVDGGFHLKRL